MNISGIGKRIISLREQKDWSQRELAKRVGVNPSVMNRIELEDRPIKDFELDILASVLGTSTDFLLGRELNEGKANYDSLENNKQMMHLLGMNNLSKQTIDAIKHMKQEDIEEIKRHIEYIIYRRKELDKSQDD